jgi:hypothetical protein
MYEYYAYLYNNVIFLVFFRGLNNNFFPAFFQIFMII